MDLQDTETVAVCGATGRQGGAVVRHLLASGRRVRALTRDPQAPTARRVAALGAEVVRADMSDVRTLEEAFDGVDGVYSVQNPMISGRDGEVIQGKNVGDAAKAAGVKHVVYGSAGVGARTGVGSWDSKLEIEEHLQGLGITTTILRPMAFMELMTDKSYYPAVSTWHVMPKLMGSERKVVWLAVDDLGAIAAKAFAEPNRFADRTIMLAADVRSIDECRAIWARVRGKPPRGLPMPVRLFERVASDDLTTMWRWLRTAEIPLDTGPTLEIHPEAMTVEAWLRQQSEERRDDGQ